jgi:hypothetical protein
MQTLAIASRSDTILGFFHVDLLHRHDVTDSITDGIDDFDVLDVQDRVSCIVEMFHIVPEAFIMLLLDGL